MKHWILLSAALAALLSVSAATARAGTIHIQPTNLTDVPGFAGTFLAGGAIGETFTAPVGGTIADLTFSLKLEQSASGTPTSYYAYISAWDNVGFQPTGPNLGNSGLTSYLMPTSTSFPATPTMFDLGAVQLTQGNRYVVYLKAPPAPADGGTNGSMHATVQTRSTTINVNDPYMGGEYVIFNSGQNTWTSFDVNGSHTDINFDISLAVADAPEPSTSVLLGVGLCCIGAFGFRMRRKLVLA